MKKVAFLLIAILGFIIFFKVFSNGFVDDDQTQIVNNPLVYSITNIPRIFQGSTYYDPVTHKLHGLYYKPLMLTFYTSIISIFGMKAFFLHFFQIMLYILNAYLVFLLFRRFFSEILAVLLAIIFLVHPINSEVAAYIADAQDVLYFFFGMLALTVMLYKKNNTGMFLSCIFLLLSLLSKETGILFFVLFILIICYGRLFGERYWKKQFIPFVSTIIGIIVSYGILRLTISTDPNPSNNILSILSDLQIQYTIPSIMFFYIKTLIFPKDLVLAHLWVVNDMTFSSYYFPLILDGLSVLIILLLGYLCWKKKNNFVPYLFFTSWLTIGILFHLNLFFRLDLIVAERWFYFPFVGLLGLVGIILGYLPIQKRKYAVPFFVFWIVIILLLSIRTNVRLTDWKDESTLYTHDLKVEDNPLLENVYGNYLLRTGKKQEANYYLQKSAQKFNLWIQASQATAGQ